MEMGIWQTIQDDWAKKGGKRQYEKQYGVGSWGNRKMADNFLNRMRQEKSGLYLSFWNGAEREYEKRVRSSVQEDYIATHILFPSFAFRFEALSQRGVNIKQYKWVIESNLSFKSLNYMIQFQKLVQELSRQSYELTDLKEQIKKQGIHSQEVLEIQGKIESLMDETLSKMEILLNPYTERFNDATTKEESFVKLLNEKVDKLIEHSQKIGEVEVSSEKQLESIRQLKEILGDDKVSDAIKSEAKDTISEIEKSIALQKEHEEKEQAELNARSVIKASSMVHNLKRRESKKQIENI